MLAGGTLAMLMPVVAHAAVDYDREVRPVLVARCYPCHGPDAETRKAGLRLDTFDGATAMLASKARAIEPGHSGASAMLHRLNAVDPDLRMPPDGREPPTAKEIEIIDAWIAAGAQYTQPWAFRAIENSATPIVREVEWPRCDIDRFVLATRESAGLAAPTHDINPSALLRRASFDLTGLPPREADLRAFAADPSDTAFAAFVDRALASTEYGERWGRHWLDLARYAETLAHEFDYGIPEAWRYRDYVIDALNSDITPARFVSEQIAGDLLSPRAGMGLPNAAPLGTAWWFLGPATHSPVDVRHDEADRIAGAVDVAGRSLFGLSIACARCHDHKFDPIPTKDFYALAGVARNTRRVLGFVDTDANAAIRARDAQAALDEAALLVGVAAKSAQSAPASVSASVPAPAPASAPASAPAPAIACIDDAHDGGALWMRSGHAFTAASTSTSTSSSTSSSLSTSTPTPTLTFALAADGSLRAAESGTIDSSRVDARLVGSARSPAFAIDKRYIHLRVRGASSWMRMMIDNYWLDDQNGLLFEGMRRRLADVDSKQRPARDPRDFEWRFETFDLARYQGERAYIELTDDGAGWVEVDAIIASDDATPPAPVSWDTDGAPANLANGALLPPIADVAADVPADVAFLAAIEAARAKAVAARDALLACTPPIRALIAEESGAFDEPVHVRGSPHSYGEIAPRAQLTILGINAGAGRGTRISPGEISGSGRLAFANAITSPDEPYLWRTLANRVWLKLFGRGIVETPDDFGQLGAGPWSRELLDHLAGKLAHGATLKQLIREVVLSHAYRATADADADEAPSTAWSPLVVRRLDAEAIRDAMLVASTRLDAKSGGPSVAAYLTEHMQGRGRPGGSGPVDGAGRRSVYLEVRRNFLDPFLQAFDQPVPATTCGRRHASNVPAQALALLNSELVHDLARAWGQQLEAMAGADDAARIESMWFAAFARAPRDDERSFAADFLASERVAAPADASPAARETAAYAALAHAIFAAKEFVFLR